LIRIGETEKAKKFVDEVYEKKKKERTSHLLTPAEREYVELLFKLGEIEKARLFVESAYEERAQEQD